MELLPTSKRILIAMLVVSACSPAVSADDGYNSFPATPSLADQFLSPQNAARAQLGVAPLVWDSQLQSYAQNWANRQQIFGACLLQHSGGPYGENIFWGSGRNWAPADAVSSWLSERRWYSYFTNSCFFFNSCGHYTQVVSRFSQRIGCARAVCSNGDVFMTCNYYPPGNNGQRPF